MSAERAANVVQMPGAGVLAGLEALIDARVEARLRALGIGAVQPKRRELRVKAGFGSARDLATAAQVSAGYVSALENGRVSNPGVRERASFERLCSALNVTPYEYISARTEG
jgi:transcriptional regulator with XRE-family HTH domain